MSVRHTLHLALALLAAALLLAPPARADLSAEGIYQRRCASCHGADGSGNVKKAKALKIDAALLTLGRLEADMPRDVLRQILLEGKNDMPAFKNKLKPSEVDPLLDYTIRLGRTLRGNK